MYFELRGDRAVIITLDIFSFAHNGRAEQRIDGWMDGGDKVFSAFHLRKAIGLLTRWQLD